jgi:hypothetical protein
MNLREGRGLRAGTDEYSSSVLPDVVHPVVEQCSRSFGRTFISPGSLKGREMKEMEI